MSACTLTPCPEDYPKFEAWFEKYRHLFTSVEEAADIYSSQMHPTNHHDAAVEFFDLWWSKNCGSNQKLHTVDEERCKQQAAEMFFLGVAYERKIWTSD